MPRAPRELSRREFLAIAGAAAALPLADRVGAVAQQPKRIRIRSVGLDFEREPLIRPTGFKGGYLTELWQPVARLDSDGGRSHIGTVHAIALCNGLEAAMGVLAEASIPPEKRWIPKGMEVSYTAKATTDITCIAETDAEQWTGDDPDVPVRVRGVRKDGTVVIEGTIRLWVTPKKKG